MCIHTYIYIYMFTPTAADERLHDGDQGDAARVNTSMLMHCRTVGCLD